MNDHSFHNSAFFAGQGWRNDSRVYHLAAEHILAAHRVDEVIPVLRELDRLTQQGYSAFGWISYEAAEAFGLPIKRSLSNDVPRLWFGLCSPSTIQNSSWPEFQATYGIHRLAPSIDLAISQENYANILSSIREHIAQGETYQVNYTVRAHCQGNGDGVRLFIRLYQAQPVPYAACLQTETQTVFSLSPELFLQKTGNLISTRPMKGTIHRGRTPAEDRDLQHRLQTSEKERAENIMILDMARNDLGRVCRYGSVHTKQVCNVERYHSLFQMTSTVTGELLPQVSLPDILQATFPAASITGAPKHRTMELIRNLEDTPRSIYCGAVGWIHPGGDFTFNVAIRTLTGQEGQYTLGVGGGIVWDSQAEKEYKELQTKIAFMQHDPRDFSLIETMRLNQDGSLFYLDEHIDRMQQSADYWDIPFHREGILQQIREFSLSLQDRPAVIRVTLDHQGTVTVTHREIIHPPKEIILHISFCKVHSQNRFLFHKTTCRTLYDEERKKGLKNGYFETVFTNEKGHITEGCITNLLYRIENQWYTPPLEDGLLAGIWRQKMIQEHQVQEKSIRAEDLRRADAIWIGNSVLGTLPVHTIV